MCLVTSDSATLWTVARQAPLSVGFFENTEVGYHFLLQPIFLTQGPNPCFLCLLHSRQILHPLSDREALGQGADLKGTVALTSAAVVLKWK